MDAAGHRIAQALDTDGDGTVDDGDDPYASRDRPMLVETAALYNTVNSRGVPEQELKQAWWRQVLDATAAYPTIGAISWLELARPEAEIDGEVADWRATHTTELAGALRADLAASDVRLGPVTEVVRPFDEATRDGSQDGAGADGVGGLTGALRDWVPVGVGVLAGCWVVSRLVRRRTRP